VGREHVVLNAPLFDEHLSLLEGREDLSIETFLCELPDDLLNALSLTLQRDIALRPRYCHWLAQNLDHFLGDRPLLETCMAK
jgi:hypothetical protein